MKERNIKSFNQPSDQEKNEEKIVVQQQQFS